MKIVLSAITAAVLMLTQGFAREVNLPTDDEIAQILSDRIDRDQAGVGMAVAVIENGTPRFIAHGQFGIDDPRPVDEHTLFEAGSITKVFTNLLLAQLVLAGKIDLDAPIAQYLPDGTVLPTQGDRAITAFDLATHTSGLPRMPDNVNLNGTLNPYGDYKAEALLEWLADVELIGPIGKDFAYSNAGTALLGLVITHVDGRPYAQIVQEEILAPLGMDDSFIAMAGRERPDMAKGHNGAGDRTPYWDFESFAPAGGLVSTASDLAKFVAAASGQVETPLKPAFALLLERTHPIGGPLKEIGLGFIVSELPRRTVIWHNGGTGGFRSIAAYDRDNGNGVVVLSNRGTNAGIDDIGMHILDRNAKLTPQPKPRVAITIEPAILERYVGDYQMAPGIVMSVTAEQGQLFVQLTGQDPFAAYPESETKFFLREVDAQISFTLDGDRASKITLHQDGRNSPARRIE